jgi:hypothetical protein
MCSLSLTRSHQTLTASKAKQGSGLPAAHLTQSRYGAHYFFPLARCARCGAPAPPTSQHITFPPSLFVRACIACTHDQHPSLGSGLWVLAPTLPWHACPPVVALPVWTWALDFFFSLIAHSDGANSAPSCQRRALPMSCNLTLACLLWHVSVARYRRGCDACGTGKRPRT